MKLTKKEINILYTLLNYHLNTIGEISSDLNRRVDVTYPEFESKGYVSEMEKLEDKLAAAAFGLKPK